MINTYLVITQIFRPTARARALEREAQQAHTLESDEEDVDEELAGKYELSAEVDLHEELDEKVRTARIRVTITPNR